MLYSNIDSETDRFQYCLDLIQFIGDKHMLQNVVVHPSSGEVFLHTDPKDTEDESCLVGVSHITGYTQNEYSLLESNQTVHVLVEPEKFSEDTQSVLEPDLTGFIKIEASVWLV